jgi:hypothetical protein
MSAEKIAKRTMASNMDATGAKVWQQAFESELVIKSKLGFNNLLRELATGFELSLALA